MQETTATYDVFVSYSRKDSKRVLPWVEELRKLGVSAFVDLRGIEGSTNFAEVIAAQLERCKLIMVFVSEQSLKSRWVNNEVTYAMDRGKPVLPVLVEGIQLSGPLGLSLASLHHIPLFQGPKAEALRSIRAALELNQVLSSADRVLVEEASDTRSKKRWLILAGLSLLVVGVAAAGWWVFGPSGPEIQVNETTIGAQQAPECVPSTGEPVLLLWQSDGQDDGGSGIFGRVFDPTTGSFTEETQINTYGPEQQSLPRGAMADESTYIAVWMSLFQDGDGFGIFGQLLAPDLVHIGTEFQVNSYTVSDQTLPSAVGLPGGGFLVFWQSLGQDGDDWGVFGQRFNGQGAKDGVEFRVNQSTAGRQKFPVAAVFPDGGFVVVWEHHAPGDDGYDITAQLRGPDGKVTEPDFRVNNFSKSWQRWPDVAAVSADAFLVTWTSYGQDGSGAGVIGQVFDQAGARVGHEFQANTFTAGNQWISQAAAFGDSGFIIAWMSEAQDGSGMGGFARSFDVRGAPQGPELQLNEITKGDQRVRAVCVLPGDNVLFVWESASQDGDDLGVFGRQIPPARFRTQR
jgi:hypothetical protein